MTMNTNAELIKQLQAELDRLLPLEQAGDDSANVKRAIGLALQAYLKQGHQIRDLPWFDECLNRQESARKAA